MIEKLTKLLRALGYRTGKNSQKKSIAQLKGIIGFQIDLTKNEFLLDALEFLQNLKIHGAEFSSIKTHLLITIDRLVFQINSWEELFILNEVFVDKVYNIESPSKFAVIDIGMNVGISSLYFASKEGCEKIFAYEPFAQTIEKAKKNLELNPAVSGKITVFNIGLGFPERKVGVYYSEKMKGSVGIYENALVNESEDKVLQGLEIRDVTEWIRKNFDSYNGAFIVKIDCEGAEYEIIRRLNETNLLQKISYFMIEWHGKGPKDLASIFLKNDYTVMEKESEHSYRGMIYCKKENEFNYGG